eukprot:SAG22_NODE_872_length_6726_cov_2.255923_8_plen_33_part_00
MMVTVPEGAQPGFPMQVQIPMPMATAIANPVA